MFTSDIEKGILKDLIAALFCVLFGAVYEAFGHGVYSYFMIYAFVFPLALGVLPMLIVRMRRATLLKSAYRLWHAGIATLTVGSLVTGALDIYGTTNPLTVVYWIAGGLLLVAGGAVFAVGLKTRAI